MTTINPPRAAHQTERTRVLIVDDSAMIRSVLKRVLDQCPDVEVVGTAADGADALKQIERLRPHVVTLDLEMPVLDGLSVLKELRKASSRPKVIVLSALSERGASITLDALSLGAADYLLKPSASRSNDRSMESLKKELIARVLHFGVKRSAATSPSGLVPPSLAPLSPPTRVATRTGTATRRRAVVIAISTGGPNTLAAVIPQLPADLCVPVFIVQHMPPMFTAKLAQRLAGLSRVPVVEATDGQRVMPGTVYLAPGDYHMKVRCCAGAHSIALDQGPPENSCRPAADVLFRSAIDAYQGNVVAAVMTGMGHDGLKGAEMLKARGAYIIAQNEASSVVWGMPGSIVAAKLADTVLADAQIVPHILEHL